MKLWKSSSEILTSGLGLSIGSTVVGSLPASAASAGVQSGLGAMGSFYPMIGTLGGASIVYNQLNSLRRLK